MGGGRERGRGRGERRGEVAEPKLATLPQMPEFCFVTRGGWVTDREREERERQTDNQQQQQRKRRGRKRRRWRRDASGGEIEAAPEFFLSCHGPSAAVGRPAVLSHRGKEEKQHTNTHRDTHKEEDK